MYTFNKLKMSYCPLFIASKNTIYVLHYTAFDFWYINNVMQYDQARIYKNCRQGQHKICHPPPKKRNFFLLY